MSGSALTNWGVFGNSAPETEVVRQAPDMRVQHASDTNKLRMKGWSPSSPGAWCKSFPGLTEADVQKVCRQEPTAVDYVVEFTQRYP